MNRGVSVRLLVVLVTVLPLALASVGVAVHVMALNDVGTATAAVEEELVEEVVPISDAARSVDELLRLLDILVSDGDLTASERGSLVRAATLSTTVVGAVLDDGELTDERAEVGAALDALSVAPDAWPTATPDQIDASLGGALDALRDAERIALREAATEARFSTGETVDAVRRGLALASIGAIGMLAAAFVIVAVVARPLRRLTAHVRSGEATARQYRSVPSGLEEICELREALAQLSATVEDARRELERQATTDPLTGLANRTAFTARLEDGEVAAVALVDLDGFKSVNDTHGHGDGDRVLVEVARRLSAVARAQDLVVRLGGDEFAVVIGGEVGRIATLATRAVAALAQPIDLGDRLLSVGASAGWAVGDEDPVELVRRADLALFAAKEASGNQALAYAPWMSERARQRERRARELRAALDSDQVRVELDPIVELDSGRPAGHEAFVRCDHPDGTRSERCRFEAELELHGLADQLVLLVVGEIAARLAAEPPSVAVPRPWFAVNVPSTMLATAETFAPLGHRLRCPDLDLGRVVLEIPGPGLIDAPDGVIDELRRLRGRGLRVTADQAGEGAAILPHLHHLPIDALKPAVSIFREVMSDRRRIAAVAAVAELVSAYGLELIAAGIEDAAVVPVLLERGIALGQGPGVRDLAGSWSSWGAATH